ncbi:MAG: hypothetical protein ACYDCP_09455, partial [Thermoplasmataceae archaeon]
SPDPLPLMIIDYGFHATFRAWEFDPLWVIYKYVQGMFTFIYDDVLDKPWRLQIQKFFTELFFIHRIICDIYG